MDLRRYDKAHFEHSRSIRSESLTSLPVQHGGANWNRFDEGPGLMKSLYVHPGWPQCTFMRRRACDVEDPSAGLIPSRQAAGTSPAAGLPYFSRGPVEDRDPGFTRLVQPSSKQWTDG